MRTEVVMALALLLAVPACSDRGEERSAAERREAMRDDADSASRMRDDRPDVAAAPTASDQPENEADRELTADIRRQLTSDASLSTSAQNVTIVSRGGVVTLRGRVSSQEEKSRIEAAARQSAGVKQVRSEIEVAP